MQSAVLEIFKIDCGIFFYRWLPWRVVDFPKVATDIFLDVVLDLNDMVKQG